MSKLGRYIKMRLRGEEPLSRLIKRGLVVGKNLHMSSGVIIDPDHCWLITIGDNVKIAPHVHIFAHDGSTKDRLGHARIGRVDIGNNVLIGAYSIIVANVRIGNNVGIAAGSVVTKDIPDNVFVAGNPARPFTTYDDYIQKNEALMAHSPVFDARYTTRGGITPAMKQEMRDALEGGVIGFVE